LHAIAARGQPIVKAIYRFKQERGLWPYSLNELCPDYIEDAQTKGWCLNWRPSGWWQLICYAGLPDWAVRYGHKGNDDGWAITDGVHDELMGVEQPLPPSINKLSVAQVQENRVRALQRRIEHDAKRIVHRQALVTTLYRVKDYDAARDICLQCQQIWPEHYWPYIMLARIDAQSGQLEAAKRLLWKWASDHKDFTHHFLLAQFLHEVGDKNGAREALEEAAKLPLADLFGSHEAGDILGWGATQFSWDGALMAYYEEWYDIARQICARWEEYNRKELHTKDPGYCAMLAACELAQGNYMQASVEAKRAREVVGDRNRDWTANFETLEKAIAAEDKTFRYKPRFLEHFLILPEYE
jgi:hypothetical protein